MRLRLHGPIDRVTGSCYEMYSPSLGVRFLIDCGMRQGDFEAEKYNTARFPFNPREIKFVVLTHAHMDHCGLLPRLYKEGFRGTVYCTKETAELANISLLDASRYKENEFTKKDVEKIKWHEPDGAIAGAYLPVHKNIFLKFFRTAHLLGAVAVTVLWGSAPQPGKKRGLIRKGG